MTELPMWVQLQMPVNKGVELCPLCDKAWHGEPRWSGQTECRSVWGDDPDAWLPKAHTAEEGEHTWWDRFYRLSA